MKTKTELGQKYVKLVGYRAGMFGPVKAEGARKEIDSLVKIANDEALEEAARSLARTAAMGGSDYDSEYSSSLEHLKTEREKLNAKTLSHTK